MEDREKLNSDITTFFAMRDQVLETYPRHWYARMCENREKMGLPFLEFDPGKNYIPRTITRDMTGVPIPGQHPELVEFEVGFRNR